MRISSPDFLSMSSLTSAELTAVLELAERMKAGERSDALLGKSVVLLFEHPSLRTRVTFEIGIHQLGGHSVYLAPSDVKAGERELVADVARNLERWAQGIVARVKAHTFLLDLARWAHVPVINALSNVEHPCQVLADLLTLRERLGDLPGRTLVFVGDGNNVCHSLLLGAAKLGMNIAIASPAGYEPKAEIVALAQRDAELTGSTIRIERSPETVLPGADAVYTDVWASMGQETEQERRRQEFAAYQVNAELLARAKPNALIMHCLPAHRGEEITDEAVESPLSVVFDQAENRLHAQKALMSMLL